MHRFRFVNRWPMARKCRFTAASVSLRRGGSTSSASRLYNRAGLVCYRRNSRRSNENWKRKDYLIRHGKNRSRDSQNESELSPPRAVQQFATFSTFCGGAPVELKF